LPRTRGVRGQREKELNVNGVSERNGREKLTEKRYRSRGAEEKKYIILGGNEFVQGGARGKRGMWRSMK